MRALRQLLAGLALLTAALAAGAGELVTEVFSLQYRSVEDVAPILRPLVPPPGAVTGLGDRLVVKTTPDNLSAVAEVLGRIDRAPRRLLIRVRQEREENLDALRASAEARLRAGDLRLSTGRPGGDDGARVEVYGTQSRDEGSTEQQVQTIDGRAALIRVGTSVPVGEQYLFVGPGGAGVAGTVRYLDLTTGFYALPRVSGDQVTIELSPFSARPSGAGGGVIDTQSASSVVSGRLGEWLVAASSVAADDGHGQGILYSTRRRGETHRLILLRVDELR